MNRQMKQVKFEILVDDINNELSQDPITQEVAIYLSDIEMDGVGPLNLIFDNANDNDYLKIILSKAKIYLKDWYLKEHNKANINDINTKIVMAKELIRMCREPRNRDNALKFIFWSLFAVSVDKSSYEEKISLIADFAHMIDIDEKTILDITQVIKVIFGEEIEETEFQTDEIPREFKRVLKLFDNYREARIGIFSKPC